MRAENESQVTKKGSWRQWLLAVILVAALCVNGVGLFLGNVIYKETSVLHSHMNEQNTDKVKQLLENTAEDKRMEDVAIESRFGYALHGTYIPNPKATDKTLIFLHGFAENRAAGLSYLDIYRKAGFNVLLVDSRAHGQSGGSSVTWGNYEKYDLDKWVEWVQQRFPAGEIGVHGVSMGAATALMHAELNEADKRVGFYIADSAYSDFETLLAQKVEQHLDLSEMIVPKILLQYANVVAYYNSRFTFHQASPIRSVHNVTTPVLYIHGENDKVVPASMSMDLYRATKGPRQIYMFPRAQHVAAVFSDRARYGEVIQNFVYFAEQQSI